MFKTWNNNSSTVVGRDLTIFPHVARDSRSHPRQLVRPWQSFWLLSKVWMGRSWNCFSQSTAMLEWLRTKCRRLGMCRAHSSSCSKMMEPFWQIQRRYLNYWEVLFKFWKAFWKGKYCSETLDWFRSHTPYTIPRIATLSVSPPLTVSMLVSSAKIQEALTRPGNISIGLKQLGKLRCPYPFFKEVLSFQKGFFNGKRQGKVGWTLGISRLQDKLSKIN